MNKRLFIITLISTIIFQPLLFSQTKEKIVINCVSSDREVLINGMSLDLICNGSFSFSEKDTIWIKNGNELCFSRGCSYNYKPQGEDYQGTFEAVISIINKQNFTITSQNADIHLGTKSRTMLWSELFGDKVMDTLSAIDFVDDTTIQVENNSDAVKYFIVVYQTDTSFVYKERSYTILKGSKRTITSKLYGRPMNDGLIVWLFEIKNPNNLNIENANSYIFKRFDASQTKPY